jgi:hypothetical protein
MKRTLAILAAAFAVTAAHTAAAQDINPGPGTLEVTVIPAGGTFFTSKNSAPNFGNYTLGGSVSYNFNRTFGVEGEVGGSLGIAQDLTLGSAIAHAKTPNTLDYSGNFVVSAPQYKSFVPYGTIGVGGMTMFERAEVGVFSSDTFLTGNVGGGVKWYAPNGRWGVRGDYRFIAVRGQSDAPAFFGRDDRYGHRVYAGLIVNAVR